MATDETLRLFDEARKARFAVLNTVIIATELNLSTTPNQHGTDPADSLEYQAAAAAQRVARCVLGSLDFKTTN